jgi:hypothetical protein
MNAAPSFRSALDEALDHLLRRSGVQGYWSKTDKREYTLLYEQRSLTLAFGEITWKRDTPDARSQYPVAKGFTIVPMTFYEQHRKEVDTILRDFQCHTELAVDVLLLTPIERLIEVLKTKEEEKKD